MKRGLRLVSPAATALLVVFVLGAAGGADAQAFSCNLALSPTKCQVCVDRMGKAAASAGPSCAACASLPTAPLQDSCIACLKDNGAQRGCAACVGRLVASLINGTRPAPVDVTAASQCFGCYAGLKPALKKAPVCVPCWLSPGLKQPQRSTCNACVLAASDEHEAAACGACANPARLATEKQCYDCVVRVKPAGAKELCGLSPKSRQEASATKPLLEDLFFCLEHAHTEAAAQLCTACLPAPGAARALPAAKKCFSCLLPVLSLKLKPADVSVRAGLCTLPSAGGSKN